MNKKLLALCGGCAIAGVVIAGVTGLSAKNNCIGVLDLDRVQVQASAYEKVRLETEKHISALKARFAAEEKALQDKAAALKKKIEAAGNKTEGYTAEIQKLNAELAEFQRKVRFQSALIAKARQAALGQVAPVAQASLKELSQKQGLKIILPRPYVTYYTPSVDVTDDFIKLLDGKDIPVAYPDPAQFTVPVVAEQGTPNATAQAQKK